jgi:hypothetical protein
MAALSSRVMTHSVIASTVAKRWVWPFRQPSPKKATTRSAVSLVRIEDCILVRATTDFQAVSWERYAGGVFNTILVFKTIQLGENPCAGTVFCCRAKNAAHRAQSSKWEVPGNRLIARRLSSERNVLIGDRG